MDLSIPAFGGDRIAGRVKYLLVGFSMVLTLSDLLAERLLIAVPYPSKPSSSEEGLDFSLLGDVPDDSPVSKSCCLVSPWPRANVWPNPELKLSVKDLSAERVLAASV